MLHKPIVNTFVSVEKELHCVH